VYLGQLDDPQTKRLLNADSFAVFSDDHLLFVRDGALLAQEFNLARLEVEGDPFAVATQVGTDFTRNAVDLSATSGVIVYRPTLQDKLSELVWFDRKGNVLPPPDNFQYYYAKWPTLSRDGRRLAFTDVKNGSYDVWISDLDRGVATRFTFKSAFNGAATWAPDGSRLAFSSIRGHTDIFMKPTIGNGDEELVHGSSANKLVCDWSEDGRQLLFRAPDPNTKFDLWAVPVGGDRKIFPVVNSTFNEPAGSFSPDGNWLAFQSDETGRYEVYVQPFPGPGAKIRASTDGGGLPRWRRDGKELFYSGLDGTMFSVGLEKSAEGLVPSTPRRLFKMRMSVLPTETLGCQKYDVTADGQRFVAGINVETPREEPAVVILNWNHKPVPPPPH
jgi:dipeptidyl aminopeptidase/acylaminoacyl peptidase